MSGEAVELCYDVGMSGEAHELNAQRIVSGGQTGVDRGALDAAVELGLERGGWCPRGRLAEDGVIPPQYQLRETASPKYSFRTEQNVIDSDATLILHAGDISAGTEHSAHGRQARKALSGRQPERPKRCTKRTPLPSGQTVCHSYKTIRLH